MKKLTALILVLLIAWNGVLTYQLIELKKSAGTSSQYTQ